MRKTLVTIVSVVYVLLLSFPIATFASSSTDGAGWTSYVQPLSPSGQNVRLGSQVSWEWTGPNDSSSPNFFGHFQTALLSPSGPIWLNQSVSGMTVYANTPTLLPNTEYAAAVVNSEADWGSIFAPNMTGSNQNATGIVESVNGNVLSFFGSGGSVYVQSADGIVPGEMIQIHFGSNGVNTANDPEGPKPVVWLFTSGGVPNAPAVANVSVASPSAQIGSSIPITVTLSDTYGDPAWGANVSVSLNSQTATASPSSFVASSTTGQDQFTITDTVAQTVTATISVQTTSGTEVFSETVTFTPPAGTTPSYPVVLNWNGGYTLPVIYGDHGNLIAGSNVEIQINGALYISQSNQSPIPYDKIVISGGPGWTFYDPMSGTWSSTATMQTTATGGFTVYARVGTVVGNDPLYVTPSLAGGGITEIAGYFPVTAWPTGVNAQGQTEQVAYVTASPNPIPNPTTALNPSATEQYTLSAFDANGNQLSGVPITILSASCVTTLYGCQMTTTVSYTAPALSWYAWVYGDPGLYALVVEAQGFGY